MPAFSTNHLQSTTQEYLEIYDVLNDIYILKNGSASMVLTTTSLNFGLLSEEEQDAIIYTYAGLLNSLSFPIQIVIRSQRKDISGYLQYLQELEKETRIPLRKTHIRRYREFVGELVKERNILDKKFYIVLSYSDTAALTKALIPKIKKDKTPHIDKAYIVEKAKIDLEPKRDHLIAQFARIGLQARQLNTQELIHLMYNIYNPGASDGQLVTDTKSYTTPVVEANLRTMFQRPTLQDFSKDSVGKQHPIRQTHLQQAPVQQTQQTVKYNAPQSQNQQTPQQPQPQQLQPQTQQAQPQLQPQQEALTSQQPQSFQQSPQPVQVPQRQTQQLPDVFPQDVSQ